MALVMAASTLPVQAAGTDFADIYDAGTATAVAAMLAAELPIRRRSARVSKSNRWRELRPFSSSR